MMANFVQLFEEKSPLGKFGITHISSTDQLHYSKKDGPNNFNINLCIDAPPSLFQPVDSIQTEGTKVIITYSLQLIQALFASRY